MTSRSNISYDFCAKSLVAVVCVWFGLARILSWDCVVLRRRGLWLTGELCGVPRARMCAMCALCGVAVMRCLWWVA
jgi:hypothetical protein